MANKPSNAGKPSTSKPVDYRRADSGEYTTEKYAEKHPGTTIKETRKK